MQKDKCACPYCQQDITELVQQLVLMRIKEIRAEKARVGISPEQKAKSIEERVDRIKKWNIENPEKVKANALKASRSRTAETFARQRQTVKETVIKKNLKFAELLFSAREQGRQITPELESQLLREAGEIIKEENKQAKKNAREQAKLAKKIAREQAKLAKKAEKQQAE